MKQISRTALMPYSCEQMFDVVNDVMAYPEFLPWCAGARIIEQSQEIMLASLNMERAGVSATFTTRNLLRRPYRIDLSLVDGPFRSFSGHWLFTGLGDAGCKTEMSLRFDFSSRMLDLTLGRVFGQAADTMVEAFHERAQVIYG